MLFLTTSKRYYDAVGVHTFPPGRAIFMNFMPFTQGLWIIFVCHEKQFPELLRGRRMGKQIMSALFNERECFIGFKTTRRSRVVLDPIKHMLRVFWTASKTFLKKRVPIDFITNILSRMLEICIPEKHFRYKLVCKKIKSHKPFDLFFYQPKRTWHLVSELFGSLKVPRNKGI